MPGHCVILRQFSAGYIPPFIQYTCVNSFLFISGCVLFGICVSEGTYHFPLPASTLDRVLSHHESDSRHNFFSLYTEAVLASRIRAMWNHDQRVRCILLTCLCLCWGAIFVLVGMFLRMLHGELPILSAHHCVVLNWMKLRHSIPRYGFLYCVWTCTTFCGCLGYPFDC
jgi:hypothetical protein